MLRSYLLLVVAPAMACSAWACALTADVDETPDLRALGLKPVACVQAQDCRANCDAMNESLSYRKAPQPYTASRCELVAMVTYPTAQAHPAPSCLCLHTPEDPQPVLLSPTSSDPCLQYGSDRSCLYEAAEFPGCDLDRPASSCQAVCGELQARQEKDAAEPVRAQMRGAVCGKTGCHCVFQVKDACFVDAWLDAYACEYPNERIVATFEELLPRP
ncbi:MAG: hypothetical protein MUF54_13290 [Polyangiaceae bacterium]|nr:hypothetical protein [Polyangiaceae bacterium]